MRRCSAILLLASLAAVAGLRFSMAAADTEAMRCAVACGHAGGAVKGAICCPMAGTPGAGPTFQACSPESGSALTPFPGQPLFFSGLVRLLPPDATRPLDGAATRRPMTCAPRPVDHVPLLLG